MRTRTQGKQQLRGDDYHANAMKERKRPDLRGEQSVPDRTEGGLEGSCVFAAMRGEGAAQVGQLPESAAVSTSPEKRNELGCRKATQLVAAQEGSRRA